ncbi:uncharacterized protein AB675_4969 [Cyphellophora attinorum]|uniref:Uncharacterized protein n=1 Tax=Cyphellophora attinorum TaxID=1664694 RepID=A0A0N1NZZ4_9EURO|nr:uncharacterized protein AB675_4969 [Phialophora attinorum]KPI39430.1 hypothetical protein AB675_4969 [Phialophora attinorum]
MASEIECMLPHEIAQTFKTYELEQTYQHCLRDTDRIYEDERARLLRVQLLLLEDENEELQDKLDADISAIENLEDTNEDMRSRLAETQAELQRVEVELKARSRENERYKAEIDAQNQASSDTQKILSEKLALSRELAVLKPELEHLRSQTSSQQNALAEKLALQRELSSAQVELENEKRIVQRLQSQREASGHDDSALHSEIDDLKKEVASMRTQIQKNQREIVKKQSEWETQKDVLESKLDAFRTKLRTTKEQLKEAQDELEKSQAAKMAQSAELTKARLAGKMAPPPTTGPINPRKRNVARFDPDMTIGTPGQGGAAKKQRSSVSIGDKSSFSMTPFLNRTTMSILPETPSEDVAESTEKDESEQTVDERMHEQIHSIIEEAETQAAQRKAAKEARDKARAAALASTAATKAKASTAAKPTQPLKESTATKGNKVVQKKPALDKVTEEDVGEEPATAPPTIKPVAAAKKEKKSANSDRENDAPSDTEQNKASDKTHKRKRPNIFDEDDKALPVEPKLKKVKTLKVLGKAGGSGLGNVSLLGAGAAVTGGKAKKTFAEFSPLKKDRRAAVGGAGSAA